MSSEVAKPAVFRPRYKSLASQTPTRIEKVKSCGIIVVRRNIYKHNRYEIVLIRRRVSYEFNNFVLGNYNIDDVKEITGMMNRMTVTEKLLIMSQNFQAIWYHLFLCNPAQDTDIRDHFPPLRRWTECSCYSLGYYRRSESKYVDFMNRPGYIDIVADAKSCDTIWEIPKGRVKSKNERNLTCAIREMKEETGLTEDQYDLMVHGQNPEPPSIALTYVADDGVKYNNIYFIAMMSYDQSCESPRIKNICQVMEIDSIKWVAESELEVLVGDNRQTFYRLSSLFAKTLQYLKSQKFK